MNRFGTIRIAMGWLALCVSLPAQQYMLHAYSQADGLKNTSFHGVARDRDGFLWVATENGVFRFLGSSFRQFGSEQGIEGVDVHSILADSNGTVWAGTEEDLYRWDGKRFIPAGTTPISIPGARRLAEEDERHLLVVDKGRLFRLEHDEKGHMLSYAPVIPDGQVAALPELGRLTSVSILKSPFNGQRIWVGNGKKLYSLSQDRSSNFPGAERGKVTEWGGARGLPEDDWNSVLLDRNGALWAAGTKHVVVLLSGSNRFIDRSFPGADQRNSIGQTSLVEDPQGRILVPARMGIARWDGATWQIIAATNGMKHISNIVDLSFDGNGDLAFASRGDGLYVWPGYSNWEGWSDEQGLPSSSIWAILPMRPDRVLIGTDHGPAWIHPDKGTVAAFPRGRWAFGQLTAMGANKDGSFWVGTRSGAVLRIDPGTGRTEQTAKLPGTIFSAFQGSTGQVFFLTNQGIFLRGADARETPRQVSVADGLLGETAAVQVSPLVQGSCESPDGAVWLVGNNRILREKNDAWSVPRVDGMLKLHGTLLGLSCAADGTIWATGDKTGTWRLTPQNEKLVAWKLEVPAELRSLSYMTVLRDRRGWIWLGTDLGLVVWNGNSWRHLSQESGLISDDTNQGVMKEGSDGSIWIGTSGGVAHLLHPERTFDPIPLTASLTEIRSAAEDFTGERSITLPWSQLPLVFRLSSPTILNRSDLKMKIRLIGSQPDWLETEDGIARFSKVDPGSYVFTAMTCNPGFSACSQPVRVKVLVLAPWWRSYWFFAFCGTVLMALLFAGVQLYARHLRIRSKKLEQLIGERTRELELSRELLSIQATHDSLTGTLNRAGILHAMRIEMERAKRENRLLMVALTDLDHFKLINDSHGHLSGDEALHCFAAAMGAAIRPYDRVGRYGGEEFLLILTNFSREGEEERLRRLHGSISNLPVKVGDVEFILNCSIGATLVDPAANHVTIEGVLGCADKAMYEAKAAGRNRVVLREMD